MAAAQARASFNYGFRRFSGDFPGFPFTSRTNLSFTCRFSPKPLLCRFTSRAQGLKRSKNGRKSSFNALNAANRSVSSFDEEYYEERALLDEQDIVTFLDPPKELIPLEPASFNPAAYLWKKIEDIPEERRHRLLHFLKPRLISRAWEIAGTRYDDPKLARRSQCNLLSNGDVETPIEFYNCRTSEGPLAIAWMNFFNKAIFSCRSGNIYGRFIAGSVLEGVTSKLSPLYFVVRDIKEVMSSEQPCDYAYEFGDGLFDIHDLPQGFPKPVKHPYPFNDQIVVYVRSVGPGVLIGQAWQEGKALEQVPRKLCTEILMVKHYSAP